MNWLGGVVSLAKSIFSDNAEQHNYKKAYSSLNSSMTNYDPDKLEVAKLENEKVYLVKEAQRELMQFNSQIEIVMIEARCKGFQVMQNSMISMLKEINTLAEERLILLESGSLEQVKKIELMYAELSNDIQNDEFMATKIPQLLNLANQFPENSDSRKLYMSGIDREIATHFDFKTEQLKNINERCQSVVNSTIASKEHIQLHIDAIIAQRIEHIEKNISNNVKLNSSETLRITQPNLKIENLKLT